MRGLGYRTVGWTLTLDKFVRDRGVTAGVEAMIDRIGPGNIILAHDGPGRSETLDSLALLLARLADAGYRLKTVGGLFAAGGRTCHTPVAETSPRVR